MEEVIIHAKTILVNALSITVGISIYELGIKPSLIWLYNKLRRK